jgi:hypothetical protein
MSITAQYVRVSDVELQQMLKGEIKKVDALLDEHLGRVPVGAKADELDQLSKKYTSFWRHMEFMQERMKKAGISEKQLLDEVGKRGLHIWFDLDKSWNELHLLLTGEDFPLQLPKVSDPLSLALVAEDSIRGTEHYGYGPARYNNPSAVKNIAQALSKQKYEQLIEKHDIDVEEELGEDMQKDFADLARFYAQAAEKNEAVVLLFI